MIIWQGFGFLAVLIPMVSLVIGSVLVGELSASVSRWLQPAMLLLAAWAVWTVGKRLNGRASRELIDAKTQQRVVLVERHTLFWIPMQWYAVAIAALAVMAIAG